VHEVLGAQYGGGGISADGTRKLKPSLINCRRENAFKAQQYGRWIVLNRENPSDSLGDQVHTPSLCFSIGLLFIMQILLVWEYMKYPIGCIIWHDMV
jgi:hypothetical protein